MVKIPPKQRFVILHGNFENVLSLGTLAVEAIGIFDSYEEADSYGSSMLTEDWMIMPVQKSSVLV